MRRLLGALRSPPNPFAAELRSAKFQFILTVQKGKIKKQVSLCGDRKTVQRYLFFCIGYLFFIKGIEHFEKVFLILVLILLGTVGVYLIVAVAVWKK